MNTNTTKDTRFFFTDENGQLHVPMTEKIVEDLEPLRGILVETNNYIEDDTLNVNVRIHFDKETLRPVARILADGIKAALSGCIGDTEVVELLPDDPYLTISGTLAIARTNG